MDARSANQPDRHSALQAVAGDRLLAIAHRGASWIAPENTLPAFQAAIELGVDLVELDYQESADNVPVVFHDNDLDRTTDAPQRWQTKRIPVAARSLGQLRTLDAGSWFSASFAGACIPTLLEALELITARSMALVERKAGSARRCIELLRGRGLADRVVLQAFDWKFLAECRRLAPDVALAALGEHELTTDRLDEACRLSAAVIAWNHEQLAADVVSRVHGRGLKLWTWTVDDPARMRELAAWGVDGIITNRPDQLLAICQD